MVAQAKYVTFCCQWKEVGLYGVPGSTQTKVFTAFDALEPTITCPLSGACHWFTPEMYQEHGDATSWEARGNVSAQPTAGNLSSAKKNCLKWCFCQAVKGKTRRKTCVLNKDFGGKGSFLHLWRKKRPLRMKMQPDFWQECVYRYECMCLKSN